MRSSKSAGKVRKQACLGSKVWKLWEGVGNAISCETYSQLSRCSTAIENGLEASSRRVLPALQAGGRGSDSQEMAGAVGAAARGTIEVGERDGGSDASRFSRGSGRGRGQG